MVTSFCSYDNSIDVGILREGFFLWNGFCGAGVLWSGNFVE